MATKKVRVSKKGAKASQENQALKEPLKSIEVVELSDSESSQISVVEVIKPSKKLEEKSTNIVYNRVLVNKWAEAHWLLVYFI